MAEINKLTVRGIAAITERGRYSDGANLYLNVAKGGAKSWIFLYRFGGKPREMGLGSAAAGGLTLAEARAAAAEARRQVAQGIDPLGHRAKARGAARAEAAAKITFGAFVDEYVDLHKVEWKNPKHVAQWRSTMGDSYIRELRRKALGEIETDDIVAVLKPIWNAKRETARRMRQRLERVLDAAKVAGHRTGDNPSRWQGHLALLLPKQGRGQGAHHAALPWADMPDFMDKLGEREGLASLALEFLILTACRSGEVRGAVWGEIDLAARVWSIPAARMKAGRDHRVPLTGRALDVLAKVAALRPRVQSPADIVFPGLRRAPMSDMTLGAVLKRMAIDNATPHGFRSTFRDWASETTTASFEVMETALAHAVGDATTQAYARSDLFEKRRALMETWERYLYRVGADIVQIGGVA